jgi:hypothetical protein
MWKEAIMAQFEMLLRQLFEGTEENYEKPGQNTRSPGPDLIPAPLEHE